MKVLALNYLNSLDSPVELSAKAFAIAVTSKMPTARHKHLVLEWNQLRAQHMDPVKGSHLQEAFAAAPMLSLEMIKSYINGMRPLSRVLVLLFPHRILIHFFFFLDRTFRSVEFWT